MYRNLEEARVWLSKTFGYVEHYRYANPIRGAQIAAGTAWIMHSAAGSWRCKHSHRVLKADFGANVLWRPRERTHVLHVWSAPYPAQAARCCRGPLRPHVSNREDPRIPRPRGEK